MKKSGEETRKEGLLSCIEFPVSKSSGYRSTHWLPAQYPGSLHHPGCAALFAFLVGFFAFSALAQSKLSAHWEELTAEDFASAIHQSKGVCLLPFGILEKHGPHLPLGTDLLNVRYAALHAAEQEYAVVFPEYYFGQIFEAKHQPGTIAYSAD